MFDAIKAKLTERRRKLALDNIRDHLAFFGWDVSHLSDEEIEQRIVKASKAIASVGMTVTQASKALREWSRKLQRQSKGV